MAGTITITNLVITESHGITGNNLIPTSTLSVEFDVSWSGLPADTNKVGMTSLLYKNGVYTGNALQLWATVTPAASGSTHYEGSFTNTQMHLGDHGYSNNYAYEFYAQSYSASGGVNTGAHVSTWSFAYRTYTAPTISYFAVNRCLADGTNDDSGERIEAAITFSSDSIGDGNEITLKVYRKLTTDSVWTLDYTFTLGAGVFSGTVGPQVTTLTYVGTGRFDVKAEIVDRVNPAVTNQKSIAPAFTMGEVDVVNQQESFMKRLEADSPKPGNDFGEMVRFRKGLMVDAPIIRDGLRTQFVDILTDFMTANANANAPLIGAAVASGTSNGIAGSSSGPGVVDLKSSTSANSGYQFSTSLTALLLAGGETFELIFSLTAPTNTTVRLGFHDTITSAAPVDGVYAEIIGTTMTGKARSNSVETATAGTFALVAGTKYRLRIALNAAGTQATFTLYDMTGAAVWSTNNTVSANIPTGAGRNCGIVLIATNSGTVATSLDNLDWLWVRIIRTLGR